MAGRNRPTGYIAGCGTVDGRVPVRARARRGILSRLSFSRIVRWAALSTVLAGGSLCQVACAQSAAELTTSIASAFIRNLVTEVLDLKTSMFGFGGF